MVDRIRAFLASLLGLLPSRKVRASMNVPIHKKLLTSSHENHPRRQFAGGRAPYITIHETDNWNRGADAKAHADWMYREAPYSWHETIDDKEIWVSLLPTQMAWHAGDGANGPGNLTSYAIELCVAKGMNAEKVRENAAWRVAQLINAGTGYMGVVQHNHWTGKHCPRSLRDSHLWGWFLERVNFYLDEAEEDDMEDEVARAHANTLNNVLVVTRDVERAIAQRGNAIWKVHKVLNQAGLLVEPEYEGNYEGRA